MRAIAVYVHIPCCIQKCSYCDFVSFPQADFPLNDYVNLLLMEIKKYQPLLNLFPPSSIYLGGGTPSLLSAHQVQQILTTIYPPSNYQNPIEITLEINPGTVTKKKLAEFRSVGINRLSIGVQSFSTELLRTIGRIHTQEQAVACLNDSIDCGFNNVSIDLLYGLPEQTLTNIKFDITKVSSLPIHHVSWYQLTLEEKTPLYQIYQANPAIFPNEELLVNMTKIIYESLIKKGFQYYETSNYALSKHQSQHNTTYWQHHNYLGFGIGAVSFFDPIRNTNPLTWNSYQSMLNQKKLIHKNIEHLTYDERKFEMIFLALRTQKGLHIPTYNNRFNQNFIKNYKKIIFRLTQEKLAELNYPWFRLSRRGSEIANSIMIEF